MAAGYRERPLRNIFLAEDHAHFLWQSGQLLAANLHLRRDPRTRRMAGGSVDSPDQRCPEVDSQPVRGQARAWFVRPLRRTRRPPSQLDSYGLLSHVADSSAANRIREG